MLVNLPIINGDAATNMAIDVALHENLPEGIAAFRHYRWLEPVATFGYTQAYTHIQNAVTNNLILCRRLTGGGIVDHRNDWTYALIINSCLSCAKKPASRLYEQMHQAIVNTLRILDVQAFLAPCSTNRPSSTISLSLPQQCFVHPSTNDVLRADGRKIAGAAIRRNRSGILLQGSVDRDALPKKFNYSIFQELLIRQLSLLLKLPKKTMINVDQFLSKDNIEKEKKRFKSKKWNQRR